ncbi:MAG: efflux RND transporter periplasmic adaptor subunit, partial [Candidatus Rokuibacteriota bacterium]
MTRRLGLLALVAALAAGCGDSSAPPQAAPKPNPPAAATDLAPTIVTPEYQSRATVVQTTGKVQFNEDALVRVHAPATGRVLEVFARSGDVLEPGARLLVLDSADLGAAKADYAKAVSDVERAEAALRLARELLEVKAVAQKEIREAENEARKAGAERERAAARLRTLGVTP